MQPTKGTWGPKSKVGGREGCQGLPRPGNRFVPFVHARGVRCLVEMSPKRDPRVFPFPFLPRRISLFPFRGWPFPFPLRSKVKPPPLPPWRRDAWFGPCAHWSSWWHGRGKNSLTLRVVAVDPDEFLPCYAVPCVFWTVLFSFGT